jgi:type I restriction-modification system DNA methylase subunit
VTDPLTNEELARKREEYEERAGILEFCANLGREEAERKAWEMVYGRKP